MGGRDRHLIDGDEDEEEEEEDVYMYPGDMTLDERPEFRAACVKPEKKFNFSEK